MPKPRLSRLQIWNMCFGFLGVQIGFGLQNANTSRIFQTLGANMDGIAVLWVAAPLTGLLVQPIVGHLSDKTWGPLGRRRPYFLVGAILASLALVAMPFSPSLWVAAVVLWILDASINITMEPFRAFVGDLLPDEQRTSGFAMQSVFIGAGAVASSLLPWLLARLGVADVAPKGQLPLSVILAYLIGAAGLFGAVLWTIITTREYSPAELEAQSGEPATPPQPQGLCASPERNRTPFFKAGLLAIGLGAGLWAAIVAYHLLKEVYVLAIGGVVFGLGLIFAAFQRSRGATANGYAEVMHDLLNMPKVMAQLILVQLFSWFGLFAMWVYTTGAVAQHQFGSAVVGSGLYNKAADWVGVLFGVYNGVAALSAFLLPVVAARIGRRGAHALALTLGALGLGSFVVIRDPNQLLVSMVGVGVAWASILSAPYAILSGALPARKMGVYMGIFNIFIVIPQILAATLLGGLLRSFSGGDPMFALGVGGGSMLLAAVAVLFVNDRLDPARAQSRMAA